MIKLLSFEVEGFKSSERVARVQFSEADASVIFAGNGVGKTTFLKLISAFLAQDEEVLKDVGVEVIRCLYSDDGRLGRVEVSRADEGYVWSSFNNSRLSEQSSLSLGVERGIATQAIRIPSDFISSFIRRSGYRKLFNDLSAARDFSRELSIYIRERQAFLRRDSEIDFDRAHIYLQNVKMENVEEILRARYMQARYMAAHKIQSALFDTLAIAITPDDTQFKDDCFDDELYRDLLRSKGRIIEALDDGEENNFKTRLIGILSTIEDGETYNLLRASPLLSRLLKNMVGELHIEQLLLNAINTLIEKFNAFCSAEKRLVVNEDKAFIDIGGAEHTISELSSGERHILTFLTLVLFHASDRSFLIIDEPEISLNYLWQYDLLSVLKELAPNTQIIVASHSPALAHKNTDYLVELEIGTKK